MRRHLVSRVLPGFAIVGRAQFRSKRLRALPASYALTGTDAALRLGTLLVLDAGTGTFALTGQEASLLAGRRVAAAAASFTLTGQDVTLQKRKSLTAEAASFALTGQDSGLKVARRVVAEAASFALTGTASTMRKGLNLVADAASYALAGQDASLRVARKMAASAASFALTGQAAALKVGKRIAAAAGSFALTGQDATLTLLSGASLSFTASANSGSDLTTYTFSSQSLGTAASDRKIIVAFSSLQAPGRTLSSATIGGVSATIVMQVPSTANIGTGFIIADVPSGTTGDVVLTFSGSLLQCGIAVYRAVGLTSSTPTDTASDTGATAGVVTTSTIDISAGGIAIAAAINGLPAAHSWTGLTEDSDQTIEGQVQLSTASGEFASAQTNLTVSANAGSGTNAALAVASWR